MRLLSAPQPRRTGRARDAGWGWAHTRVCVCTPACWCLVCLRLWQNQGHFCGHPLSFVLPATQGEGPGEPQRRGCSWEPGDPGLAAWPLGKGPGLLSACPRGHSGSLGGSCAVCGAGDGAWRAGTGPGEQGRGLRLRLLGGGGEGSRCAQASGPADQVEFQLSTSPPWEAARPRLSKLG